MLKTLFADYKAKLLLALYVFFVLCWLLLQFLTLSEDAYHLFGATYGILAMSGALFGLSISREWGGLKSLMGKSIIAFSLGLLLQVFGQLAYSYYSFFLHIDVPYPSIGDIGYFGSIPFYILGTLYLAQTAGVAITLRSFKNKIIAIILPLLLLVVSYYFFLLGYQFDFSNPLTILLDFGYPLGGAIYISIALLTYILSYSVLGGMMKKRVTLILFALFLQFLSDYVFLYMSYYSETGPGSIVDVLYLTAYFVMALSLVQLRTVSSKLKKKDIKEQ